MRMTRATHLLAALPATWLAFVLAMPAVAQAPASSPASAAVAAADLRCPAPPAPRNGARRPAGASSSFVAGPVRITVACVDADAASAAAAKPSAAPSSAPSASAASGASASDPPAHSDGLARFIAAVPDLILLALSVACGVLALGAWLVLRRAFAPAPPARSAGGGIAPSAFVFQRHWGGFGSASTGWVLSERLVQVVVGLALAGFAAALAVQLASSAPQRSDKAAAAAPATPASAAKAAAKE